MPSLLAQSSWFEPKVGWLVHSKETDEVLGTVVGVDGNICYFREPGRPISKESNCYIWRFVRMVYPYGPDDYRLDRLNDLFYVWPNSIYRMG